uniref:Uncharacterized protein n=1 Tax=Pyrodinium bahamense TaxID=73915 RepID=A0A7S0ADW3_9DINO
MQLQQQHWKRGVCSFQRQYCSDNGSRHDECLQLVKVPTGGQHPTLVEQVPQRSWYFQDVEGTSKCQRPKASFRSHTAGHARKCPRIKASNSKEGLRAVWRGRKPSRISHWNEASVVILVSL